MTRYDWARAHTLREIGSLTADWLSGYSDGYHPGVSSAGPSSESAELIPTLVRLNRAGFVTTGSQPGIVPGVWCQRAAVELICTPTDAQYLDEKLSGRCIVSIATPDARNDGVVVSTKNGQPVTAFGCAGPEDISYFIGNPYVARGVVMVVLADYQYGNRNLLWRAIDRLSLVR